MELQFKSILDLKADRESSDDCSGFECTICYKDEPKVPVVTPCGHLYCWGCLRRWLSLCSSRSIKRHCPVCSAAIEQKRLIYIKGRWNLFFCSSRSPFDCSICLELAQAESVITLCGHLYCRPCLNKLLHVNSDSKKSKRSYRSASCTVCNAHIVGKKLVPLYGQGTSSSQNNDSEPSSISLQPIRTPSRLEASHGGIKSSAIVSSTPTANHSTSWVFRYKGAVIVMVTFVGTLIGALMYAPAGKAPAIFNSIATCVFSDQNCDIPA